MIRVQFEHEIQFFLQGGQLPSRPRESLHLCESPARGEAQKMSIGAFREKRDGRICMTLCGKIESASVVRVLGLLALIEKLAGPGKIGLCFGEICR